MTAWHPSAAPDTRRPAAVHRGLPTSDGAGVKLTRLIGSPELRHLDPFLMLDKFDSDDASDYMAGFPPHPHRGFETVTIMIDGRMRHRDNRGNEGVIEAGGVQWMTAGRGIVHSEMPEQEAGRMWGFQLWVNLPSAKKMVPTAYADIPKQDIPVEEREGGAAVRVMAGTTAHGTTGPAESAGATPLLLDVALDPRGRFEETVPSDHTVFLAVYTGTVTAGDGRAIAAPALVPLTPGQTVAVAAQDGPAGFLLGAGAPLNEPIAWHGPFVMNTEAEIHQAIRDFQAGKF